MAPVIEGHCPKCKLYNYMVKECFFCGHVFIKDEEEKGMKDRKSTRLNSSHTVNSYAVFCLKKKKRNAHN